MVHGTAVRGGRDGMSALAARVEAAVAAWNRGDLDGYLALYDPTIRLHGYTPEPMDKAAVAGFYRMIFDGLTAPGAPAPALRLFDTIETGRWVACHFTMSGAHAGPFLGVPATGRPYHITGVTMLRFGDGETVVERHSGADILGLLVQIGAVPPPG
jgi:hypothetical protein